MRVDTGSNPAQTRIYFFLAENFWKHSQAILHNIFVERPTAWEPVMAEELVQLVVMTRSTYSLSKAVTKICGKNEKGFSRR